MAPTVTATVSWKLALARHGDPRPLPEDRLVRAAVADTFDAFTAAMHDTRLEPDLEDLLWGIVNVLHRATGRVERELDDNEQAQQRRQCGQDGSEVRSVELERLLAEGLTLIERRNAHEVLRDLASDAYDHHFGKSWRPHSGSLVSRRTLTATLIDSRDFIAGRKRAETQVMLPAGPKVAFTGGADVNEHKPYGPRSTGCTPSTPTWCCCTEVCPRAPS